MNLSLFELYVKFITVMYFILFYLNLWLIIYFLNNFVNTRGYLWIPANMKEIGRYPHNGYPMDMGTGTGRIFIQQVGYGGATTRTRTLPAPLTSLNVSLECWLGIGVKHVAFLELWLRMTSLELWHGMANEHEELLSYGSGWRVLPVWMCKLWLIQMGPDRLPSSVFSLWVW